MESKPRLKPETHAAFQVVALANRISASASRAYLRRFGVGVMEWRLLALVALKPGMTGNEASHISGVDKAAVSRATQSLMAQGYIVSAADPADHRRLRLTMTAEGEALHDRILQASIERERRLLTGLSADERKALFQLLARLHANMELVDAEGVTRPRSAGRG